jgi:hypothetical protein
MDLAKDSPNAVRSARIDRWQLRLAQYNLKFQHIPGTENRIADGLSRLPVSAMEVGVAGKEEELVEALVVEEGVQGMVRMGIQKPVVEKEGVSGQVVQGIQGEKMRRKKAVDEKVVEVLVAEEVCTGVRDGVET